MCASTERAGLCQLAGGKGRTYVLAIMTVISIALWNISIVQAKGQGIGDYGLFSALPVAYYGAFFLLLAAIYMGVFCGAGVSTRGSKYLLLAQLFLVMVFIMFTPALIEGTARVAHSWQKYGYADYIVRNGHISGRLLYHNWPAPFIFSAAFQMVTALTPTTIPLAVPLLLDVLLFLAVLLLVFRIFKDYRSRAVCIVLFYLVAWVNQFHFVPQFFGVFIFAILIYMFMFRLSPVDVRHVIMVGLLLFTLVMTHLLTTVIAVAFLGLLALHHLYHRFRSASPGDAASPTQALRSMLGRLADLRYFVLMGVIVGIILLWFSYAESWVDYVGWDFDPGLVLRLASDYASKISEGSGAHGMLVLIRMVFSAVIALVALAGIYKSHRRQLRARMLFLVAASVLPIFLFYYGVEIVQRAFLFSAIPLSVMMVMGMDRKKLLALILTMSFIAVPCHILAHYGNEGIDYTAPSHIMGAEFFFNHTDDGVIMGISVEMSQYMEVYGTDSAFDLLDGAPLGNDTYLIYSMTMRNFHVWYHGSDEAINSLDSMLDTGEYVKIYSAPDVDIYKLS